MIPYDGVKTLFFDYDGTLHNSMVVYGPAFRKAYDYLIQNQFVEPKEWTDQEISYWLGFSSVEMWRKFLPNIKEEVRKQCSQIISTEMKRMHAEKKAVLYEGALETLGYLKEKGYHLVFISNCRRYNRDLAREIFGLDQYFEAMVCAEEHDFIPKHEILGKIKEQYPKEMIMIGDRRQDIEAGKSNGIYTIGCAYGFAVEDELKEADVIIEDIRDIKKYL